MVETVLLFNFESNEYGNKIQFILSQFGIKVLFIDRESHHQQLGFLLSLDGFKSNEGIEMFDEEMIIFHQFNEDQMSLVLDVLQGADIPFVPLKAFTTNTNIEWSALRVKNEIEKEYEAIRLKQ